MVAPISLSFVMLGLDPSMTESAAGVSLQLKPGNPQFQGLHARS
ncbi:hypothetical protein [Shinella lacus]|nr:hypothetical protein [Shinella lacus]